MNCDCRPFPNFIENSFLDHTLQKFTLDINAAFAGLLFREPVITGNKES
jgi:hypothetical protein